MKHESKISKKNEEEDSYLPKRKVFVSFIWIVRFFCFVGWIGGMIYATREIFLAAEGILVWQRNPKLNEGPFTNLLGRGRDNTDTEWNTFSALFFGKLIYWYAAYLILVKYCSNNTNHVISISTLMSLTFWGNLIGGVPTIFLVCQPVSYWLLARLRSKALIWGYTMTMVVLLSSSYIEGQDFLEERAMHYFVVAAAWNYCKCVSYIFDSWDRPQTETGGLGSLWSAISYCFYFPLTVTGPLILFNHYEKYIYCRTPQDGSKSVFTSKWTAIAQMLRLIALVLLMEFILHYFYVKQLALSPFAMRKINLWVVCGSVYWIGKVRYYSDTHYLTTLFAKKKSNPDFQNTLFLNPDTKGQIFTLKYQVLYGIPSFIAELDGVPMYPLPCCPGYIHRYSVLWKDFDRGLYYFLIRYIYVPVVHSINSLAAEKINKEICKLLASLATFVYVYVWHGTSFYIFIWASLNFIGITIERIGSSIKRQCDKRWKISPIMWDFIVEPIVTVPLAGMSMLNSSIFCESLETAVGFSRRLWNEMGHCHVYVFLYFMTHVAVTIRTWKQYRHDVISLHTKSQ